MFNLKSNNYYLKCAQRGTDVPRAFENPIGKRDPYQLYEIPYDGKGRKLTTMFSVGFPGEPNSGSSAALGGSKFNNVNPTIPHPYSEKGDDKAQSADPDHPFNASDPSRPERSEYGEGGAQNFYHDDSPLSKNRSSFDSSKKLDINTQGPHGDINSKAKSMMPKSDVRS